MADIMAMRQGVVPVNPESPGAWEEGMIVDVFPDGQLGPGVNQHPKFIVIRIPGLSEDDARELLEDIQGAPDEDGNTTMIKRRVKKLDFSVIPNPGQAEDIAATRECTVPNINTLRSWMKSTV